MYPCSDNWYGEPGMGKCTLVAITGMVNQGTFWYLLVYLYMTVAHKWVIVCSICALKPIFYIDRNGWISTPMQTGYACDNWLRTRAYDLTSVHRGRWYFVFNHWNESCYFVIKAYFYSKKYCIGNVTFNCALYEEILSQGSCIRKRSFIDCLVRENE